MFDSLSDRLHSVFKRLGGQAKLDDANLQDGLREVRLALLEADVNFNVVKDFTDKIHERALGQKVLDGLSSSQHIVKIVHEELVSLLGGESSELNLRGAKPYVLMVVGLQGSGKTTSIAKLANLLRSKGHSPYLVPADVYRPAAIDQLKTLAAQLELPVYPSSTAMNPVDIATSALEEAKKAGCDVLLVDTAGRLHVDEVLMQELVDIKGKVKPCEILFVADAMTGQDAVTVAEAFNNALDITGVVLTKMDGDARGGAALSIKSVTGKNIKFVGVGEKTTDLEPFHPERVAGRILGMGDMLTLIEKAQGTMEAQEAEELAKKMQKAQFNLDDFRTQMRRIKSMGSLEGILKLIPGMSGLRQKLGSMSMPEKEMAKIESIINSMTPKERKNPDLINSSRKQRVAKGSGTTVQDVSLLLKQFESMRQMMKKMLGGSGSGASKGKMPRMPAGMPSMPSLGGMGGLGGGLGGFGGLPGMGGLGGGDAGGLSKSALKKKKQMRKEQRNKKKR